MNITPKRLALLRLVFDHPGFYITGLADRIAPRPPYGWSRQGAARWGGAYVRPVEDAGLIQVDRRVRCGVGRVYLTDAGRKAVTDAMLSAAIASGD